MGSKAKVEWILHQLGCTLDEQTFTEIFDEVDSDADGQVEVDEFITALGMLKKNVLEIRELEQSFTQLRRARPAKGDVATGADGAGSPHRATSAKPLPAA